MIEVTQINEQQLNITIDGEIKADDMERSLREFLAIIETMSNGRLLYRFTNFQLPTLQSMLVKFGHIPALLKSISHFKKAAVMSDQQWMKTAAELEGWLIPGLEIRGFDLENGDKAQRWLDE